MVKLYEKWLAEINEDIKEYEQKHPNNHPLFLFKRKSKLTDIIQKCKQLGLE